ncbi:MAG: type II secretion system protein [Verrucomicrobiota bacterium]
MKLKRRNQGFTLIELLVVISIIAMLAAGGFASYGKIMPGVRANATAKTGKAIYNWLQAYANDNDQRFPETQSASNDAYRQLFVKRYLDDEQGFAISNDPWLNNAPGGNKKPDNDIGTEPNFEQALMPGECSWAYVNNLDAASQSNLPLMANAFSESPGVYEKNKNKKGGVFSGTKAVWVSVGGSAKVTDLKDDLMIMEKKGGRDVDVFKSEWGTNGEDVKNPAG